MDVRIGITQSMRELEVDLPDDTDRKKLRADIDASLTDESGVLWLTDKKGREVAVPTAKIAYVELGTATESRGMGFGV